jgi:hypothetical protein
MAKQQKYIVIPRSNDALKEMYATANGKQFPFDTPVVMDEDDVNTLEHQREAISGSPEVNVYKIMDEMRITQQEAQRIAQARASGDGMGSTIKWVQKYSVHKA